MMSGNWRLVTALSGKAAPSPARVWRVVLGLVRARGLVALTLLVFVLPALFDLFSNARRAPFRWLAFDSFYYLTVSRNIARHGSVSFDGVHPSGGFHPLWQAWGALLELGRERLGLGPVGPFLLTLSGVVVIALALWVLGLVLRDSQRLGAWFVGLPVGVYALSVLPAWVLGLKLIRAHNMSAWELPVFGSLWSYVNGMESAFVILGFALALRVGLSRAALASRRGALLFGVSLAGLTLARLDHGLFAASLWLGFGVLCARARAARRWLDAALGFALPLALYLGLNVHYFGSAVPLSGVFKSTFPHVTPDNWNLVQNLWRGSPSHEVSGADSGAWLLIACRQLQTLVPAAFCFGYLALRLVRWKASPLQVLLAAAACGALALSGYNFCFTRGSDQGFWYYPVSTLLPTLFVLAEVVPSHRWPDGLRVPLAMGLAAGSVLFFVNWQRHPHYNAGLQQLINQSSGLARAHYGGQPPKILEIDDGSVAYGLDAPAMSCALALDREAFEAMKSGRLLDLAVARGFEHLASAAYQPASTAPEALAGWAHDFLYQDVSGYVFEKEFSSPDGQLLIVHVRKR